MKRVFGLLILSAAGLLAQQGQPNCSLSFGPWTTTNSTANQANTSIANQCAYWVMQYQVTGTPTISIQFESAVGSTAPGAFAAFTGSTVSGSNPSTSTACTTVTNCVAVFTGFVPWYRVTATLSGTGTISGTLQGYKTYVAAGGNTPVGGGCVGTIATPCVVVGVTASGAAPTTSPVLAAGQDGTNVETLHTDTSGNPIAVGPVAAGSAVGSTAPLQVAGSDGTNVRRVLTDTGGRQVAVGAAAGAAPVSNPVLVGSVGSGATGGLIVSTIVCDKSASILYSAATGTKQLVALSASQIIYVCSLTLSSDTASNITLEYGTGALCGTGTTTLIDPMQSVIALSLNFAGAVRTIAGNALCIVSSATATIGGVVTYAQF